MYHKFMTNNNRNSSRINGSYPPQPKTSFQKEEIPLLIKKNSVKDLVSIFENEKVLPIIPETPNVYDEPLTGIALLKDKLVSISRYKLKNK